MDIHKVQVIIVLPDTIEDESQAHPDLIQCYELCKESQINTRWVRESECSSLNLGKTDFVVFQSFEGKDFEEFKETKCASIIGPWCILTCLTEGIAIPNVTWPFLNVAMRDCVVTCSYLPKQMKQDIKKKVMLMGGHYTEILFEGSTHLVSDSVKSEKYITAAEAKMKLMLPSWVDAVWEASLTRNVHANDKQFEQHKIPAFQNLVISCTGFTDIDERKQIEKWVTSNGGKFSGNLKIDRTDILICKCGTNSEKYKAAKKTKRIKCVNINWLKNSIENGYAVPEGPYAVSSKGTSTPTKDGENIDPNFSMVSAIGQNSMMLRPSPALKSTFYETMSASYMPAQLSKPDSSVNKRKGSPNADFRDLVDRIDLKQAKRAGTFLDGCNIYLVGFSTDQRDKLCKILNFSGATRYDSINERMTHVIVGDKNSHEFKLMQSKSEVVCPMVTIHWLLESIECKQPVSEENYLVTASLNSSDEYSSPLSKKGLSLLRSNSFVEQKFQSSPPKENAPTDAEDIMKQYLKRQDENTLEDFLQHANFDTISKNATTDSKNETMKPTEETTENTTDEETVMVFIGLRFLLLHFNEEDMEQLKKCIEGLGGQVIPKNNRGMPNYTVVPVFNEEVRQTNSEVVNDLWITECWTNKEVKEILYYHKPMILGPSKPLKDCVIALSGYVNLERNFLRQLVEHLGGVVQEQFSRVACEEKNILRSSHLVSAEASGKKYVAALKWNRPVIDKDWLLECASTGELQPVTRYLVGDSVDCDNQTSAEVSVPQKPNTPQPSEIKQKPSTPLQISTVKTSMETSHGLQPTTPKGVPMKISFEEPNKTPKVRPNPGITDFCSQVTPVSKIMREVRMSNLLGTPESPPVVPWDHVDTPETPLGRFITENPSPNLRKKMQRYLNQFPDYPQKNRRASTPLSELKKRLWDKICPPKDGQASETISQAMEPDDELENNKETICDNNDSQLEKELVTPETSIEPQRSADGADTQDVIGRKLCALEHMLASRAGSIKSNKKRESIIPVQAVSEVKNSQPFSVGWDYMDSENVVPSENGKKEQTPLFIISGFNLSDREIITEQLKDLGARISDLANYDPDCTHVVCPKLVRNEKSLCCMAAGKWLLHTSYVEACVAAGKLLDEEEFEYGNPKSVGNIPAASDNESQTRVQAAHYWRKEVARRGYGAFHDMRAIVVAAKRDPIVRVIQAGGGMVIDVSPPFEGTVYATHCFLDLKSIDNIFDYTPLAEQGIFCVTTVYISDFLQRTAKDIRDSIIPYFIKYYNPR